jgi:hypothetical protein
MIKGVSTWLAQEGKEGAGNELEGTRGNDEQDGLDRLTFSLAHIVLYILLHVIVLLVSYW